MTRDTHLYLKDIETREEGGTPAIVESIRAGMVFQLKQVRYVDMCIVYSQHSITTHSQTPPTSLIFLL